MIFPNDVARAIIAGKVTQIRIPARTDHCPHKVGRLYSITRLATAQEHQETGKRHVTIGRIRVLNIRHQELGDAEWEADVTRECLDFDDWIAYWENKEHRDFGALRHFPTWVLNFKVHHDEPRLLAADSSKGYTDKPYLALSEEPEAVDEATLNGFRERAERRHDKTVKERQRVAQQARELLSAEERISRAREAAKWNHIDVSNETLALRQMLKRGAVIEHKLRVLERIAYREAA